MSLQNKLMAVGQPSAMAQQTAGDVYASAVATGTTQADALPLSCAYNYVATVDSGTGVRLYGQSARPSSIGDEQTVYNAGANALNVYPPAGEQIVGAIANAAFSIPTSSKLTFKKVTNTLWVASETFTQSGTGAVSRSVQAKLRDGEVSIKDFGAVCDGTTDDTTAWQTALNAIGDTSLTQRSGMRLLVPGPTVIGSTITARRKSVHIYGPGGWGRREDTGASRSYILWDGAAGVPMLKVQDVTGFRLSNIRFVGKSTAKPSAALNFNETNDGFANTSLLFENVWIGGGLDTADDAEQFIAGVLIDGDLNGSNSEIIGKNLKVYKCQYGLYVGRTQNVNIRVDGYYPQGCSSAAVYNSGQVQIQNYSSSGCAVDFYSPATDDGGASVFSRTVVVGYLSETAGRMAEIVGSGYLGLPAGGSFSLSASTNADGKVIKAEGNTAVTIGIHDLWWLQASSPPTAPFLSLAPSGTGYRHVVLETMHGWTTRMTGGTNGLSVTTSGVTDRVYLEFSEDPQTTGFFPIQKSVNFNQGLSARNWDIKRYDIWNFTSLRLMDDFLGDVLADEWNSQKGSDGACALAAITAAQNGVVRLVTGAGAGADYATNGVQMDSQLNWDAAAGSLVFECRLKLSAITNVAVYLGFTDQVSALEMPFTLTGTTFTSNATDAVGVLFDTNATTDTWRFVGVHGDTDATQQDTSLAPVAGTFETFRLEVAGNVISLFRNGVAVGTAMTNDIRTKAVTPVIAAFSSAAASRNIDIDYVYVQANRV